MWHNLVPTLVLVYMVLHLQKHLGGIEICFQLWLSGTAWATEQIGICPGIEFRARSTRTSALLSSYGSKHAGRVERAFLLGEIFGTLRLDLGTTIRH